MKTRTPILLDPAPPVEGGAPNPTPEGGSQTPETPAPETPTEPAEPEPAPVDDGVGDVLLNSILGNLKGETAPVVPEVTPAVETPPVETPPAEPAPEPAPETPPAEPAPAPEKKPKRIAMVEPTPEPEPAPTPAPTPTPADPDEAYVETLTDEQREELAEMVVAEKLSPERYKNGRKKLIEFYRKFDAEAPALQEDEDKFKTLLEAKPKLAPLDAKRVQREIGKQEATTAVRAELTPELEELKLGQAQINARPKVAENLAALESELTEMFVSDDKSPMHEISKLFTEKGTEAAMAEFPLEASVAAAEMRRSRALLAEFTLFQNRATKYDPNNRAHTELFELIETRASQGDVEGQRVKDGKRFLSRIEYAEQARALTPAVAAKKFYTFSDADVQRIIKEDAKQRTESHLKRKLDEAKAMGFERKPRGQTTTTPTTTTTATTPITAPKATPSRAKGAGTIETPPQNTEGIEVAKTLGLRRTQSMV